jgi:hypothetical protein
VTLSFQSPDPRCRCTPFHALALLAIGLGPYDRQHMTSVKPLIGVSAFSMSPCTCLRNSRSSDPRCVPSHTGLHQLLTRVSPNGRFRFRVGFPPRSFIHGNTDLPIPDTLVLRRAFDLPPVLQGGPHAICFIGKSHIAISRCLMHLFTGLTKLRFPMAYLPLHLPHFCRSDGCRRPSSAIIRAHPKFNHTLIFLPENSFSFLCLILFHQ